MTKKLTISALLVALAMILSYVEVLIPFNFGIPGIKLGLANLVVVVALYLLNARQALMISVVRILLVSLYIRQYGRSALQYHRGTSELRSDGSLPQDQRSLHDECQCCRRHQPQHWPDSGGCIRCQEPESAFLSPGTYDRRHHYRFAYRPCGRSDHSFCQKGTATLIIKRTKASYIRCSFPDI